MGSRASQLRNRQQIQDSSVTASNGAPSVELANGSNLKQIQLNEDSNNNNSFDHEDIQDEVTKIKEALHAGMESIKENGDAIGSQQSDVQQANGASDKTAHNQRGTLLQRQASHIQSLAQRIKRSSSLRAPKLRGLIPEFVGGKRKVSRLHTLRSNTFLPPFSLPLPL